MANSQKGKRLTFFQLFKEMGYTVEIPIIQRDYAQGRESALEIRTQFLEAIHDHLKNDKNIDLDFIYGSLSGDKFIPLDGQQRLTTLFLLHWYLAVKDGKSDELRKYLVNDNRAKFSYETRASSRDFCDALITNDIDLAALSRNKERRSNELTDMIKNSAWFFLSWEQDPTIKSMLVMLDDIHRMFRDADGYFEKLVNAHKPLITFQFLNLEDFKLTDDLYIKMNARGKPLTEFENFKAKFEQHIKDMEFAGSVYKLSYGPVSLQEYFSHKIDTDWANLFWNYRDEKSNTFDNQLMNFIRVMETNNYVIENSEKEDRREFLGKANRLTANFPISFLTYKEMGCLDEKGVIDLVTTLDLLKNGDNRINKYLPEKFYYYDEHDTFKKVIQNNLSYTERLQFFAYYQYLICNKSGEGAESWMRVVHNLSENTIYNNAEEYARSAISIIAMLPDSKNILKKLAVADYPVSGFYSEQIEEERTKAILILKNADWVKLINQAETHDYLKGQIGFLLKFSGVSDYYVKNSNCGWSDSEDARYRESFEEYLCKAVAVFGQDGLKTFDDFVWQRALLSKGDYLLSFGRNRSFLIGKHRDISWKRLLRNNDEQTLLIKELFDDESFRDSNVQASLEMIINNSTADDWRMNFIKLPQMIEYLGTNKNIRFSNNTIYLLKKERMSGTHAEFFSYAYCRRYLDDTPLDDIKPFTKKVYYHVSGDEESPRACVEGWRYKDLSLEISLTHDSEKKKYKLTFRDKENKNIIETIGQILGLNNFKSEDSAYVKYLDNEQGSDAALLSLCKALQEARL